MRLRVSILRTSRLSSFRCLSRPRRLFTVPGSLWTAPMTGWVGYLHDRPVTLACVVVGAGAAGVYSVGTVSGFQRRGFAETIVRHALERSRDAAGSDVTILQSTSQGIKLYAQMGYRPVTRFGVYMYENWWRS